MGEPNRIVFPGQNVVIRAVMNYSFGVSPASPLHAKFHLMKLVRLTAIALCATLLITFPAVAQEKKKNEAKPPSKPGKGPAYVSPPKDDDNFPLMGEFLGQITDSNGKQRLALQIRPIAGDRFVAMAYRGGLPGQPQFEGDEMQLIGLRSAENLILSGGPWAIFVDPKGCTLVSQQGKKLGRLKRIHRVSPTLGATPPEGAIVLFDGENVDNLNNAKLTPNGLLQQGAGIRPMIQDFNLHVEFRLPYMPMADGQSRGNSGLYLQSRYECQILDSFGTEKLFNGHGALYRTKAPDVNMAFPPLSWQTYDVHFTAPRWASDGTKVRNAHITSWVNGVKVQDNVSLPNKTGAGKEEQPTLSPMHIQDHGDPVRFQNVWIVDRGIVTADFPVMSTKPQQKAAASVGWEDAPIEIEDKSEAVDAEPVPAKQDGQSDETKDEQTVKEEAVKEAAEPEGSKPEESEVEKAQPQKS